MSNWKRIILIIFVLIGGVSFFGYWSINQFDSAFDNLSASYTINIPSIPQPFKQDEIFSTSTLALSFTFPQKDSDVYIGCTYLISWQSSTTISSLETSLIDAGTMEPAGPIASGLTKNNTIEKDLQNLKWKVGSVWPGEYYIKISKINGVEVESRSKVFVINKMPENIDIDKADLCK